MMLHSVSSYHSFTIGSFDRPEGVQAPTLDRPEIDRDTIDSPLMLDFCFSAILPQTSQFSIRV